MTFEPDFMTFNFKSHTDKWRHYTNLVKKYDFQDFWETWELGAKKKCNPKKRMCARKFPETHKSHNWLESAP